jgi:hypothetical protein
MRDRLKASQVSLTFTFNIYTPCLTDFTFEFIRRPTPPILSPLYWTFVELTLVSIRTNEVFKGYGWSRDEAAPRLNWCFMELIHYQATGKQIGSKDGTCIGGSSTSSSIDPWSSYHLFVSGSGSRGTVMRGGALGHNRAAQQAGRKRRMQSVGADQQSSSRFNPWRVGLQRVELEQVRLGLDQLILKFEWFHIKSS